MINKELASRFSGKQCLVSQEGIPEFEAAISTLANAEGFDELLSESLATGDFWVVDGGRDEYRPYTVVNGVLQIPVKGVLMHHFPWQFGNYATGYEYIWQAFKRGQSDPDVNAIAFVVNSHGGEAAGCFELVDKIAQTESRKPSMGFAYDNAHSGAYAVISTADEVSVSRLGSVGSIGVITMHVDYSERLAKDGVKVTFITYGPGKSDGNPYEQLSESARKRIQNRVDRIGSLFVETVARSRRMTVEEVKSLGAYTYDAPDAVENGLADQVKSFEEAIAAFENQTGEYQMGDKSEKMETEVNIEQVRADAYAAGRAEGLAEGSAAGAKVERERIGAIINSEVGQKRPAAAWAVAMESEMTSASAESFLAKLPEEKAQTDTKPKGNPAFMKAMNEGQHPEVGDEAESEGEGGASDEDVSTFAFNVGLPGFKKRDKA